MRKVLIIGLSDDIGGVETFFHTYYKKFDLDKYNFDFVTVCRTVAFGSEYIKNGSKIHLLPHFMKAPIRYYRKLCKIMRENKYDVVHINMLSAANILPIIAARNAGIENIIIHSHNADVPKNILRRTLHVLNLKYLRSSKTIKISCGQKAGEWLFGKNARFIIINNAISKNKFKYNKSYRDSIRRKYNIGPGEYLMGNVGRLCEQKNQAFLVDVLSGVQSKNIKLMLIGSGNKKKMLERSFEEKGISDRVIMVENTPKIERYYSAFDLFVFPSVFEGMPIAPIEAQANGLRCLISENVTSEVDQGMIRILPLEIKDWINAVFEEANKGGGRDEQRICLKDDYDIEKQFQALMRVYDGKVEV